jgi:hypothetical protein
MNMNRVLFIAAVIVAIALIAGIPVVETQYAQADGGYGGCNNSNDPNCGGGGGGGGGWGSGS